MVGIAVVVWSTLGRHCRPRLRGRLVVVQDHAASHILILCFISTFISRGQIRARRLAKGGSSMRAVLLLVGAAAALPLRSVHEHADSVLDARILEREVTLPGALRTDFGTHPCAIKAEDGCESTRARG